MKKYRRDADGQKDQETNKLTGPDLESVVVSVADGPVLIPTLLLLLLTRLLVLLAGLLVAEQVLRLALPVLHHSAQGRADLLTHLLHS